jgi:uncharacterized membrane protein YeaQ/YmgE (transglycosylase-associated protein family)
VKGFAMLEFMWWLIVGLTAGGLARFLYPGKQNIGFWGTIALGLLGSMVGGAASAAIYGYSPLNPGYHPAGLVMSTVGALVVLGCFVAYSRRSGRLSKPVL